MTYNPNPPAPTGVPKLLASAALKSGAISSMGTIMDSNLVGSLVLPANTLTVGKKLRARVVGRLTVNSAPHNFFMRFYFGAGVVVSGPSVLAPVGAPCGFAYDADILCTAAGAGGNIVATGGLRVALAGVSVVENILSDPFTAIDTTQAYTMDIKAQTDAADSIYVMSATIEAVN